MAGDVVIRPAGFIPTDQFTAFFVAKYRARLDQGLLYLRDIPPTDVFAEPKDLPILREWKTARALLARFKSIAAPLLRGEQAEFGKVWIEQLPGNCGTPWLLEEDDYAQAHIRTRTCLIPAPDAYSCSGLERVLLSVGVVNIIEHRVLHSEMNLSPYPRVHLIVDIKRPEPETNGADA